MNLKFYEPVGYFDGNPAVLDKALLVCSIGLLAFVIASIGKRLVLKKETTIQTQLTVLEMLYHNHRKSIIALFCFAFVLIALTNYIFMIYIRGMPSNPNLIPGIRGIYTWLLMFGLSSIGSFFVYYEIKKKNDNLFVPLLCFVEMFFSSTFYLSRAYILNNASFFMAYIRGVLDKNNLKFFLKLSVISFSLFLVNIGLVNFLRASNYYSAMDNTWRFSNDNTIQYKLAASAKSSKALFIDRWIGIESVIAVTSYSNLGMDLFNKIFSEAYSDVGTSLYDKIVLIKKDFEGSQNVHFINIPGSIAFFYLTGNILVVFLGCFAFALIGMSFEFLARKFSGNNPFFVSLIAQVIAYRFAHFGYVPKQSYLLFGAVFINIFLFYGLDLFLNKVGYPKNKKSIA